MFFYLKIEIYSDLLINKSSNLSRREPDFIHYKVLKHSMNDFFKEDI
jgi:hypothetical protein